MEQLSKGELHPLQPEAAGLASQYLSDEGLVHDSDGQVRPRHVLMPCPAGQLATTDVVIEPVLGLARVVGVLQMPGVADDGPTHVQIVWRDDHGPCHAAGCYHADQPLDLRLPDPADRLLIRQALTKRPGTDASSPVPSLASSPPTC